MGKRQRLVMLGIAAVIAAVAVVIAISSGGDDDDKDSSTAAQTQATTGVETTDENSGTKTIEPDEQEPAPPPEPAVTVINVKGGEPVDGVAKIKVKKGEVIRITVVADQPDHAHLHGYDIEKDVGPGQKARFREKADLEGIYELELHDSGAQLARITVEP